MPPGSSERLYATQEEADAAWRASQAGADVLARLSAAGYPRRHLQMLSRMHGPSLTAAEALLPRLQSGGGLILLIGDRGPGKTQMAAWLAWQLARTGQPAGLYRLALQLWGEIRATWRDGAQATEEQIIRRHSTTAFLVIDEIQERGETERDREWCDRTLARIVDHRYGALRPTLMIGNYSTEEYERNMPASIRSRVSQCGGVKVCDWPSYR